MAIIAFITEFAVVHKILTHLNLPTTLPPIAPARLPDQFAFDFEQDYVSNDAELVTIEKDDWNSHAPPGHA